jgi:hypothetical protein
MGAVGNTQSLSRRPPYPRLIVSAKSYILMASAFRQPISFRLRAGTAGFEVEQMKKIMPIGLLLVVLGGLALAYQGFNYTHQEKILDIGPLHATAEEHDRGSIPPALGGLALAGGIVLLLVGAKKGS